MQLNYLKGARLSETSTVKMLLILKALAQCHVVLGLIMLILSTLADYVSGRINTIRMYGLEECCSFYFIVTGLVGLCGAASYRRGLVITFLVMSIHATIIFVPTIIIVSSFDIHFYQHECWGECDWHLLAISPPKNSRCQIMCGEHVDDNMRV
uniref:PGG domain-containing protein n=1 Tax=Heterorhabditis bacteriophora TaxID=37862 RepID=A0A1I7XF34_HETBA